MQFIYMPFKDLEIADYWIIEKAIAFRFHKRTLIAHPRMKISHQLFQNNNRKFIYKGAFTLF
jgi:hypothetical protein